MTHDLVYIRNSLMQSCMYRIQFLVKSTSKFPNIAPNLKIQNLAESLKEYAEVRTCKYVPIRFHT